jgi:hypothetical protein
MHHWQRKKFKDQLAKDFLSALSAIATDCLTPTTCVRNTTSTYADTLAAYLTTRRQKSNSKRASAKRPKQKLKLRKSSSK